MVYVLASEVLCHMPYNRHPKHIGSLDLPINYKCPFLMICNARHILFITAFAQCNAIWCSHIPFYLTWWRHQMETFSAQLALCVGNSSVPVNSPNKGQWRGAFMFPLICVWIKGWVNNREAGDLRRYHGHYDVNVMNKICWMICLKIVNILILVIPRWLKKTSYSPQQYNVTKIV